MTTKKINKTHAVEDGIIALNGEVAERHRAEARVKDAKKSKGRENLTPEEDETLDELKARLAKRAQYDDGDTLAKSLRGTVSNFLRSRKRRGPELLAKSLRSVQRLVIPTGKQKVTSELFIKAANAFTSGRITGQEFNVVDLHRRNHLALPDELLKKIGE
ncbi:TPA: hypothetical protein R2K55_005774 [Raoultella ornithinolytica]|uniref:hypothetical protein n=1 Tax=Raoultella ornithinolytica TaxID=54291 RepID=UPI00273DFCE6|nr:hypothetical protein [Raoultella ornithinolytica]WLP46283.1 hypothetical protein Q7A27_00260 [Raoultella ornithinolytica]HEC2553939.1 hypothetical protein [Raoultella ornithinolytica]HEC2606744.1 hypothetical protein [Raoultella ornithinolytica]HEC2611324.1 hypothetical protein [Raoultella ornithinolytica]